MGLEQQVQEPTVNVTFKTQVMQYGIGDKADVPVSIAKLLTTPTKVDRGGGQFVVITKAVYTSDIDQLQKLDLAKIEELKNIPPHQGGLTQDELEKLGMKNIVKTPLDPLIEAKVAAAKADLAKKQAAVASAPSASVSSEPAPKPKTTKKSEAAT